MTVLTLNVSDANEGTDSPWWAIIDPRQMMKPDVDDVAAMVTGPFFSREDAQNQLNARRYAFSSRAMVYCMSGYWSLQYKTEWRKAKGQEG